MPKTNSRRPSAVIGARLKECRKQMKKHRISAYLVTNPPDYFYLTGFTGEDSAALITPRDVHLITDGRFDESSKTECPWARVWLRKGMLHDEIAKACQELKIRSAAFQPEHLKVADHTSLKKANKSTRLVGAPPVVTKMRRIKSTAELSEMQKALRVAEEAFIALLGRIRVGMTEIDLAALLEYEMKVRGASRPAFPTICAEGANAALPHAQPGRRRVKVGSALLLDWGARVDGYCSDLTRMVFVGSIPPKIKEVYAIVLEAQKRAIADIRPGRRMCDVDATARNFVKEAGFGEAFNHGLGHGLGLDVHEAPSLSWRSKEKLEAGTVVTVEPGVYLPGDGGVRIEDDVLVTPRGARILSRLGKELNGAVIRAVR